ncbi:MAG: type III-A CRISPR-associated protein Csm2 [Bacteroidetes bacterium SW_10_40_5]|nr:MAG: type III-A CRISPR-associated protein Csm2 [Bacteroidetes bacterium SW_10_40_5]
MAQPRQQDQRRGRENQPPRQWVDDFDPKWIQKGIDKTGISFCEKFGKFLKEQNLSSSQIRNVFGELKRIQMKGFESEKTAFLLLKPKMSYAVSREGKESLKELSKVFNKAYDAVDTESDNGTTHFNNLVDFMESVLAYHKAYGGK